MKRCYFALLSMLLILSVCNSAQADEMIYVNNNQCCESDFDFGVRASYLYWGVQEDQLAFAIEGITLFNGNTPPSNGRVRTHEPKWNSGVRLEAFMSNCQCPVAFSAAWTHFDATSLARAHGNQLFPTVAATTLTAFITQTSPFLLAQGAKSRFNIEINEFVVDAAYPIACSDCFSCLPYAGVIGARITQRQNVSYFDVPVVIDLVTLDADIQNKRRNNFSGIGPRFGLGLEWHFCNNINLVADANVGFMFGRFDVKNHVVAFTETGLNVSDMFVRMREKVCRGRPMTGGLIGLEWRDEFNCSFELSLAIAYEFRYWWKQWQNNSNVLGVITSGEGCWGDLSTQGLTVTAGIAF